MKPLCELCGDRHESHQAHRFATNKVATNRIATNGATNREGQKKEEVSLDVGPTKEIREQVDQVVAHKRSDGVSRALHGEAEISGRTKNRRSREAYNAYQREYMRRKRNGKKLLRGM